MKNQMGQAVHDWQTNEQLADRQEPERTGEATYADSSFSSADVKHMLESIRGNCNDNWKNIFHDIFAICNTALNLAALAIFFDSLNTMLMYSSGTKGLFGNIHSPLVPMYYAILELRLVHRSVGSDPDIFLWPRYIVIAILGVVFIFFILKSILCMLRSCCIGLKLIIPYPYSRSEEEDIIRNYEKMEDFEALISDLGSGDYTITMSPQKDKLTVEYTRNAIGYEKEFHFFWKDGEPCQLLDYKNAVIDFGRMDTYYGFNHGSDER